jgi:hypothetical protein
MGMILLDIECRAERAFGIEIPREWPEELGRRESGDDATLADLHEYILRLCREQGRPAPSDSWPRLLRVVADAAGAKDVDLSPSTQLIRDIAPFGQADEERCAFASRFAQRARGTKLCRALEFPTEIDDSAAERGAFASPKAQRLRAYGVSRAIAAAARVARGIRVL